MRKKIILIFLFFLSSFVLAKPIAAQTSPFQTGIDDQAHLLGTQSDTLKTQAQHLSDEIKASVFVVTTQTNTQEPATFARNYLSDQIGSGKNGIVLLIDMGHRKVYIWATGNMKYYMTKSRIDQALDHIQPPLTNGDYLSAVTAFYRTTKSAVSGGIPGKNYTVDPVTGDITFHRSFQPLNILVAVIVALLFPATFYFSVLRRYQMKDASAKVSYNLAQNGQLNLTQSQDTLINRFVTTRQIPRNTDSNGGSGGQAGSGGGRSF